MEWVRYAVGRGQSGLAGESRGSKCPTRDTGLEELRRQVGIGKEESGYCVAPHFIVGKFGPDLKRIVDRSAEQAVAAKPVESGRIDCADGMKGIPTEQCEIGQTQHRKVACVGRAAIRLFATSHQAAPHLLHRVGIAERHA